MRRASICVVALCFSFLLSEPASESTVAQAANDARMSALLAAEHLAEAMDEFHTRFPVYDDVSSAGNHFHALAKIPDAAAPVAINGSDTSGPHSGATAIRNEFHADGGPFGGFFFLNGVLPRGATAPELNFGDVADAGVDLRGATTLRFWARGQQGSERVQFFMGGAGRNPDTGAADLAHPDSTPRHPPNGTLFTLTADWQEITIDLRNLDLSYVLNGFGWVASIADNPTGAVFFLDDIQYDLDATRLATRLAEPRFIRSFTTEPFQERPAPVGRFDLVLRNIAFTYDSALALIAFLAVDTPDALVRARLIGDALVYASTHDRTFDDGRVRDAYAAGDLILPPGWVPNDRVGTVPVSGFYDETKQEFFEIEQAGVSTGNNAWAMLALLQLFRRTHDPAYLDAARRIGAFIRSFRADDGRFQGFRGGFDHPEPGPSPAPTPSRRPWASTEHNLDCYAAFSLLALLTSEDEARADAEHARVFVEAMFDEELGCYLAGTIDPETRNQLPMQLPLDTQAWTVLALPETLALHPRVLDCARTHHQTTEAGFTGFDFNDDRDGVWFEGTGHVATALAFTQAPSDADPIRATLRSAQSTVPFGDGRGIVAAAHDGVSTGFNTPAGDVFLLFRRLHVGATAWDVFAQLGVDPFYGAARCDADASSSVTVSDGVNVLRSSAGLSSSCPPVVCDANRDGAITVTDAVNVLRQAADLPNVCTGGS